MAMCYLQYAIYAAVPKTGEYHSCSTEGSPQMPVMQSHECYEVCLIRSGDFAIISQDICCRQQGSCMIIYNQGHPHAQFDSREITYERLFFYLWYPSAALPLFH